MSDLYREYCVELLNKGVIAIGEFKLTYGPIANVYVDSYKLLSFPDIQAKLNESFIKLIDDNHVQFDCICGTAYAGLPFASLLAHKLCKPLINRPKEKQLNSKCCVQPAGTGSKCLVVEEVIASGRTVLDAVKDLEKAGYIVTDIIAFMDRSQNGIRNLCSLNYNVYPLFSFMDVIQTLHSDGVISKEQYDICVDDCNSKFNINGGIMNDISLMRRKRIPYQDREALCNNAAASRLFRLMSTKKTNLMVDFISSDIRCAIEALETIGSEICLLCVHSDAVQNLNEDVMKELKQACDLHNVMLLDDRKVTSTIEMAMLKNHYVLDCVDFITLFALSGRKQLEVACTMIDNNPDKGIFIVTDFVENFGILPKSYVDEILQFAELHSSGIAGVISLSNRIIATELVHIMPNVYNYNLDNVIDDCGADASVIVLNENDDECSRRKLSENARRIGWDSYIRRLNLDVSSE